MTKNMKPPKNRGKVPERKSGLDFPQLAETITRVDTALRGAAAASVNRMLTMRNIEGIQIWQLPTAKSTLSPIWQKPSAKLHNEIANQAVTDISPSPEKLMKYFSFSHFVELIRLSDPLKRAFLKMKTGGE
jgi:hypothetical protein